MSEIKNNNKVNTIREEIKGLNLGEVSELIEGIKEDFNIQETVMVQPTAAAPTSEDSQEKSSNVSVRLVEIGSNRIQIYKEIVSIIKEQKGEEISPVQAKNLVDKEDKIILENIAKDKAESIKKQLEDKGAKVEIK